MSGVPNNLEEPSFDDLDDVCVVSSDEDDRRSLPFISCDKRQLDTHSRGIPRPPNTQLPESVLEPVRIILENKNTRRTFELLCSVVEPRLESTDWIHPILDYKRRHRFVRPRPVSTPFTPPVDPSLGGNDRVEGAPPPQTVHPCLPITSSVYCSPTCVIPLPPTAVSNLPGLQYACNPRDVRPNTPDNINLATKAAAQRLLDVFEMRYTDRFESLVGDAMRVVSVAGMPTTASDDSTATTKEILEARTDDHELAQQMQEALQTDLISARAHYMTLLRGIFAQQINWGRIIAMLGFLRALCEMLESSRTRPLRQPPAASTVDRFTPSQSSVALQQQLVTAAAAEPKESPQLIEAADRTDFVPMRGLRPIPPAHQCLSSSAPLSSSSSLMPTSGDRTTDKRAVHYLIWTTEFIHEKSGVGRWIAEHGNWEGLVVFGASADDRLRSAFIKTLGSVSSVMLGTVGLAAVLGYLLRRR